MTIDDIPSDDELAAAYLDNEADPAERARVEADPRLLRRVEQFRAVRAAVGATEVSLDDHLRDGMIERALAAADLSAAGDLPGDRDAESAPVPPAIQLDDRRRGRRRPTRIPAPGLVAAAVAVLLLIGAGLVLTGNDRNRSDQATNASRVETAGGQDEESDAGPGGTEPLSLDAGKPATSGTESEGPGDFASEDLGDFANASSLRQTLAADKPITTTAPRGENTDGNTTAGAPQDSAPPSTARPAERCAQTVTNTDSALEDLVTVREASIDGSPVWIFTHTERDDPSQLIDTVVDQETCQVVFALAR